jgi:hypothetical protein
MASGSIALGVEGELARGSQAHGEGSQRARRSDPDREIVGVRALGRYGRVSHGVSVAGTVGVSLSPSPDRISNPPQGIGADGSGQREARSGGAALASAIFPSQSGRHPIRCTMVSTRSGCPQSLHSTPCTGTAASRSGRRASTLREKLMGPSEA